MAAGAGDVREPNDDDDIEDLEGEGEEWIIANEAYEDGDDDDDDGDYHDGSLDSSSDSGFESDKPRSRKRSSLLPKIKGMELEPEMSFEEEQEFLRLSQEFARQLQEEEAKREVAELNWRSENGEKKGVE